MRETWTFHSPGQLIFGRNATRQLGEIARRLAMHRILLVTDPVIAGTDVLDAVLGPLEEAAIKVDVFREGEPEPSFRAAYACIERAKKFQPEAVLGLGGGSNMDLAKICATVLAHGGSPGDFVGDEKIPGPIWPLLCVPTTAGTGSEVSAAAVLTDHENKIKVGILSNFLRPRVALVDPLLTVSCPPRLSADSGIDALTHAIEAFTAIDNEHYPVPASERSAYQGRNPMASGFAEHAIILMGQYLVRAVQNGQDLDAREAMSLAATLAGLAFSNSGVALVHAMEYPVGGAVHCSHGTGNGLLLPYVMRYNLPGRERQFAEIAALLGEQIDGLPHAQAAELAIEAVARIRQQIGIPARLRDLGVKEDQLHAFAEKAHGIKRLLRVNPRMPTLEHVEAIYREAF